MSCNLTENPNKDYLHLCSILSKQEPLNPQDISSHYIDIFIWISCCLLSASIPVTVVGNNLVLVAMWTAPPLRKPSYVLLSGLAFTDLCTGLIIQPFHIVYMLSDLKGNKPVLCASGVVLSVLATYFLFITAGTMTLLSLERWLHMSRSSFFTNRRVGGIIATLLLFPIPLIILYMWPTNFVKTKQFALSVAIVFGVICFILTPLSYCKVIRIINQHQQQVQSNQACQLPHQSVINLAKYKKSVVTIFYILVIFLMGVTPTLIWLIIQSVTFINDKVPTYFGKHISYIMVLSTSSINPVLYCCRMKEIREGVVVLLKRVFCKAGGS